MITIDPQQELFTTLKLDIEALGYDVYDGFLPPDGTPYPFVYLGNSQSMDKEYKGAVGGTVYQTIHVWHSSPDKRGTVSEMLLKIKNICRRLTKTDHFSVAVSSMEQNMLIDKTTKTPLLHGVLTVGFRFI